MAISGLNSIKTFTNAATQRVLNVLPSGTINSEKANKAVLWIGKHISSPENRLILGVSALMSQPFIDLSNKKIDEDTRKVSAARTVAKIIAGTTTGVLIRYACIKAIDAFCKLPEEIVELTKHKRLRTFFTPFEEIAKGLSDLKLYKNALGTLLSLGIMVFTNFLIDAPMTRVLTNKFIDKIHAKDKLKAGQADDKKEVRDAA
ncbi:MAG: hypothetical protein NC191_03930 [Muribaculaceae bacterium]|nr:hypothetical protein [Muribaculaceae bacterium]